MKRINNLLYSAILCIATATVWWPLPGMAQGPDELGIKFWRLTKQNLKRRTEPAQIVAGSDSALAAKGYVKIGTIDGSREKEGVDVAKVLRGGMLIKAAEGGGDLVRFDKEGVSGTIRVPEEKSEKRCLHWREEKMGGGTVSRQVQIDSQGHVMNLDSDLPQQTVHPCDQWKTIATGKTVMKKVKVLSSYGTVWRYDPELAPQLIDQHLEPRDQHGNTRLELAVMKGRVDEVKRLLAQGADVNATDDAGWTPLMIASRNGARDVVELLLAHGADVNAKDHDGHTASWWADQGEHKDIADSLR